MGNIFIQKMLFLLLFLSLPFLVTSAEAIDRNTAFLPLKINSQTNAEELTKSADAGLAEALKTNDLTMVDRDRMGKMVRL